jgi:hypothetical protein
MPRNPNPNPNPNSNPNPLTGMYVRLRGARRLARPAGAGGAPDGHRGVLEGQGIRHSRPYATRSHFMMVPAASGIPVITLRGITARLGRAGGCGRRPGRSQRSAGGSRHQTSEAICDQFHVVRVRCGARACGSRRARFDPVGFTASRLTRMTTLRGGEPAPR